MKYIIWLVIIGAILGIALYAYKKTTLSPTKETSPQLITYNAPITNSDNSNTLITNVAISNFSFNPPEVRIKKGSTVTWTNNDNTKHSIISDTGSELKSDLFDKDMTFSHTFNTVGIFNYHCVPHTKMTGSVIVE